MKVPKGRLLIIGGKESKGEENDQDLKMASENQDFDPFEILKEFIEEKNNRPIEVITTASSVPDEMSDMYKSAFKKIGFKNAQFMNMDDRVDARKSEFLERIEKAHAVFFTGGNQFRLATIMGCSEVVSLIHKRYVEDKDFVVAGTSAGAMAMSKTMLERGQTNEALLKGDVRTSSGLGLIDHCIIDTHFISRGRIGRLVQAIITNPSCIGIGLGEDTALLVTEGNKMECLGSGMVIILDGGSITQTNIAYAEEGKPLCVENVTMHILSKGNGFLLKERKFLLGEADSKKKKER